jgi:hypothetical protein
MQSHRHTKRIVFGLAVFASAASVLGTGAAVAKPCLSHKRAGRFIEAFRIDHLGREPCLQVSGPMC